MNQTFGEHPASGPAPSTAGFHKHDILNKLDPRVDSTMEHHPVAAMAAAEVDPARDAPYHHTGLGESMHGAAGPSSLSSTTATATRSHQAYDNRQHHILPEGTYGPTHSSRPANTLGSHVDPSHNNHNNNRMNNPNANIPLPHVYDDHRARHGFHHGVDVATNSSTIAGAGTGHGLGGVGMGQSHGGNQQHNLPSMHPHGTSASRYHDVGGNVSEGISNLPGPAPNTAGPHRSDFLNRLDPRVDSKGGHSGY
ncbi:hypothetical protein QBC32DRAFT_327823 [Pseudoneurospora amorphoporcata]|uniref:Uncharacterized protein n=1 Tax=Pseudoneurospora amorphoporcata TaxID=241081 RepID=A0AAN6SCY9_9PEZI|nr:hypothetical protein QBC32DRAFT_327823 [Pseudoneurospora amorphoporcata]